MMAIIWWIAAGIWLLNWVLGIVIDGNSDSASVAAMIASRAMANIVEMRQKDGGRP